MSKKKAKNKRKVDGAHGAAVADRELIPDIAPDVGGISTSTGLERYLDHIAHLDMPVEMKIKLIGALHEMMRSFVDRAFGDDPVQLATHRDNQNKTDTDEWPDVLKSEFDKNNRPKHLTSGFRRNAGPHEEKATEQ